MKQTFRPHKGQSIFDLSSQGLFFMKVVQYELIFFVSRLRFCVCWGYLGRMMQKRQKQWMTFLLRWQRTLRRARMLVIQSFMRRSFPLWILNLRVGWGWVALHCLSKKVFQHSIGNHPWIVIHNYASRDSWASKVTNCGMDDQGWVVGSRMGIFFATLVLGLTRFYALGFLGPLSWW